MNWKLLTGISHKKHKYLKVQGIVYIVEEFIIAKSKISSEGL